ncbi:ribonuclease III [Trueperella sp. LYQ143]|uniref:ribonuclease III n=1 Tax=unclassified Trueperella TaxID=2630174 RepID=UPI0039836D35
MPNSADFQPDDTEISSASALDPASLPWAVEIPVKMLDLALTHRSWAYENNAPHNERLEFLGDSVLGGVAAAYIYDLPDELSEGDMSKIKAAAVSERSLAELGRELRIGQYIKLGRGEELSGGRDKDSILADTVEALIGATFLAHGILIAREVILDLIRPQIDAARRLGPALDWRTALDERARDKGITGTLSYKIEGEGPDHARVYTAQVFIDDRYLGTGTATSQKAAKLEACKAAYYALGEE